jgi:prepilin signal peptidase PulO-like enzyme (type II secretory pathway)
MVWAFPLLDATKEVLIHAAPGMPPDFWWMTASVLGILALTATIDAFTETVPDGLIFLGLLAVTGTQGMAASWSVAALHLRQAIEAGLLIWVLNFLWYHKFHYDALGMGDAKWTMLAVACFGVMPVVIAWGLGAILAVIYIGGARLARYQVTQVTFAPFLFLGLAAGLYVVRFAS